jgi:hypothetical protein
MLTRIGRRVRAFFAFLGQSAQTALVYQGRHDWVHVLDLSPGSGRRVFQWEHLALANKLRVPLRCSRCRETALCHGEDVIYGCSGGRADAPGDHE